MRQHLETVIVYVKKHPIVTSLLFSVLLAIPVVLMTVSYYKINSHQQYVLNQQSKDRVSIGLVLGAGINKQGKPYDELKARLDKAADELQNKRVATLILSGDNRLENYDEPTAMKKYLVETRNIAPEKLTLDFAGRSTYGSCERAAKVFQVKKLIIFSAASHLPRAIYLCRHFGVEAYGVASGVEANNSTRRELLARVKAIYNTTVVGEKTVLGGPINLE